MTSRVNIEQQVYDYVNWSDKSELITRNGIIIEAIDECSLMAEY